MNLAVGLVVLFLAIIIIRIPEFGFVMVLIIPLVKNLLIPPDSIFFLNLSFIFMLVTILSVVLKYSSKIKSIHVEKDHILLFLLFLSVLMFSILYTDSTNYGLEKLLEFVFFNCFFFIFGIIVFQSCESTKRYLEILKYSILILSTINAFLVIKYLFSGSTSELIVRFTITGSNPIGNARVMGLGLILWFYSLVEGKNYSSRLWCLLALITILLSLIATNTRGPFFSVLIVIIIYVLFFSKLSTLKKTSLVLFVILVISVTFSVLPENLFVRYAYFGEESTFNTTYGLSKSSSSAMRLIYFRNIFEYFHNFPISIILGTGIGNFSQITPGFDIRRYPHNIFMEILFEQGIIGVGIFLFGLVFLIQKILQFWDEIEVNIKSLFIPFLLSFLYFFLNAQVSGDISDNRFVWLLWGGIIGMLSFWESEKNVLSQMKNA
ncbi:MAG: O-antigen ligase family protein [Candidatus Marinimicrobia bacterium]|nr:O-antigen ligase family protein [Candidatus Neomarinimicrobiota bacterium]